MLIQPPDSSKSKHQQSGSSPALRHHHHHLSPGKRRGTATCGRGDRRCPAGTRRLAPSCSPPPSCCSGTAASFGCSCKKKKEKKATIPTLQENSSTPLKLTSLQENLVKVTGVENCVFLQFSVQSRCRKLVNIGVYLMTCLMRPVHFFTLITVESHRNSLQDVYTGLKRSFRAWLRGRTQRFIGFSDRNQPLSSTPAAE